MWKTSWEGVGGDLCGDVVGFGEVLGDGERQRLRDAALRLRWGVVVLLIGGDWRWVKIVMVELLAKVSIRMLFVDSRQ